LPLDLAIGDTVDFLSAGAYTASVAPVGFKRAKRKRHRIDQHFQLQCIVGRQISRELTGVKAVSRC